MEHDKAPYHHQPPLPMQPQQQQQPQPQPQQQQQQSVCCVAVRAGSPV